MAHVIMEKGNVSLLHNHYRMKEVYFILEGMGKLYINNKVFEVQKGAYVPIPLHSTHKLENIGKGQLEHLVFVIPPFDANDVHLIKEKRPGSFQIMPLMLNKREFTSLDGAIVYELGSEKERQATGVGFAAGFLPGDRKAKPHHHKVSEELYYVISGQGKVRLDDKVFDVKKGSLVYIPTKVVHGLGNTYSENLEILCVSSPCYKGSDFILA